ncbi:MAG: DUF1552 domain-containing protein [Myxococcota bacterium]|nr:DUF1552 domain-containing protein [Myxococcota bacterium]
MSVFSRRRFLTSASGLVLPLPVLPSLAGCKKEAEARRAHPLVVMRAASGVAQEDGDAPEQFWPRELGTLTRSVLADDNADRITATLADHAEHLLMVRGTRFPFAASREVHAGGGNQLLTAAQCGPLTDTVMTYAMGESVDNWIARHATVNHGEPLTLYAGRRDNYGEEVLSYRGPQQLRGADSDPWAVYQRLIGAGTGTVLRDSVNDLVLDQLIDLRLDTRLSAEDRTRLELHTDSVRDFEILCGRLSSERKAMMLDLSGRSADDAVSLEVARLQCDLIALVLSCDQARAATLQIGDRLDRCHYEIDGFRLPTYHELTHGLVSADAYGPYTTTWDMHADVNRLHLKVFAYLLDRLLENGVLDSAVAVFCSDVATGSHRYDQIPWIIAGRGDGTLRSGAYVDAGDVTHDRLLATLLTATGHRHDDGSPIERFGDESLQGGLIDTMLA